MPSLSDQKSILRKQTLQQRDQLDEMERIEMSLAACDAAKTIPQFTDVELQPGTVVSGFNPIRSEIDPRPLMTLLAKLGAQLCLPVVTGKTTIEFRELIKGAPMISTGFGTYGPDDSAKVLDPQIILVPLSVFDRKGGRIGYGGGFYDRAIERLIGKNKPPLLIGVAFSMQETHSVPMNTHDRYLDGILTEKGFIEAQQ